MLGIIALLKQETIHGIDDDRASEEKLHDIAMHTLAFLCDLRSISHPAPVGGRRAV